MNDLVKIKTRTKIIYKWAGESVWLKDEDAERVLFHEAKKPSQKRIIAYVIRCRPRFRR